MRMLPETEALFDAATGDKYSCSVVIGEAVLFFGGRYQKRQISQLSPFGIIRIGTLPFTLESGICLVMGSQLFLGFSLIYDNKFWSR